MFSPHLPQQEPGDVPPYTAATAEVSTYCIIPVERCAMLMEFIQYCVNMQYWRAMHVQNTCTEHMYRMHVQNTCTGPMYKTRTERMYRTHVQNACTEHMYRTYVQNTCTEYKYKTHILNTCTECLYRTHVMNTTWIQVLPLLLVYLCRFPRVPVILNITNLYVHPKRKLSWREDAHQVVLQRSPSQR